MVLLSSGGSREDHPRNLGWSREGRAWLMLSGGQLERLARKPLRLAGEVADVTEFRSAADDLVKRTVGWDFAIWSTVDPTTFLFTNCRLLGLQAERESERRFFELDLAGDDVTLFPALALDDCPARSLHLATEGDPDRSRRFRELLRPAGCGDELRAVFLDGH